MESLRCLGYSAIRGNDGTDDESFITFKGDDGTVAVQFSPSIDIFLGTNNVFKLFDSVVPHLEKKLNIKFDVLEDHVPHEVDLLLKFRDEEENELVCAGSYVSDGDKDVCTRRTSWLEPEMSISSVVGSSKSVDMGRNSPQLMVHDMVRVESTVNTSEEDTVGCTRRHSWVEPQPSSVVGTMKSEGSKDGFTRHGSWLERSYVNCYTTKGSPDVNQKFWKNLQDNMVDFEKQLGQTSDELNSLRTRAGTLKDDLVDSNHKVHEKYHRFTYPKPFFPTKLGHVRTYEQNANRIV